MTRIDVHPLVLRKAVEDLEINCPIYAAYIEGDQFFIHTRNGTHTLPVNTGPAAAATPADTPSGRSSTGLDDYTAINGVGSVTASKLHGLGLYTYDDLREWIELAEAHETVNPRTADKIRAWLSQHLL